MFCLTASAQEKDELWDVTIKMEMPGMPMAIPPRTSRVCVTKGANEETFVPQQGECKTVESKRTGNKYTYKTVCDGKNKMTSTGEMTFGEGSYDGRMQMTGTVDGQTDEHDADLLGQTGGQLHGPFEAQVEGQALPIACCGVRCAF